MTTANINFHWENEKPHVSIIQYNDGIPDSVFFRSEVETDSGYAHEWNVKCIGIINSDMSNLTTTHKIINENSFTNLIRKNPTYYAIDKILSESIKREDKRSYGYYGRFMPIILSKSGIKI